MDIRHRRGRYRLRCAVAGFVTAFFLSTSHAEDRVIVRGNYYRERSTRVLQPTIDVTKDILGDRISFGAGYMLDAISSASVAAGAQQVTGGDTVFTELRHETTGRVAARLGAWQLGTSLRYSTETDYEARQVGLVVGLDMLARSINVTAAYAYNFDRVYRIFDSTGRRLPWCGGQFEPNCRAGSHGRGHNLLQVHYARLGYTQAVHRFVLLLGTFELSHGRGPQDNPYRGGMIANVQFESHPFSRTRTAVYGSSRIHLASARTTLEPRYRFSTDDWGVRTHAIDLRVHFRALRHVIVRARYRFYIQNQASFWRDDGLYPESTAVCTPRSPGGCASADPKLDDFVSHTPGIELTYALDGLAKYRGLQWLGGAWIEVTYNHVFQTNRYGDARLGSLAFSLAL